jgi:hypothetical protein
MEKENIVMQYIAAWGWFIISVQFLVGAFIIFFSGRSMGNTVMFIVFLGMWGYSVFVAVRRKSKIYELEILGDKEEANEQKGGVD